jgi:YggT family protein
MFIFSNLLSALANVVDILLTALYWIVIIRALISWVNPDPFNPIVQFLQKVTDPILEPIRRVLPFFSRAGIDISPIIAIMAIIFLKSFLVKTLLDLSFRLH